MIPIAIMPINSLPLRLAFFSNGCIGFERQPSLVTVFDQPEEGISAVISKEELIVGTTKIAYNQTLEYKKMPELLAWLQQQRLENPFKEQEE